MGHDIGKRYAANRRFIAANHYAGQYNQDFALVRDTTRRDGRSTAGRNSVTIEKMSPDISITASVHFKSLTAPRDRRRSGAELSASRPDRAEYAARKVESASEITLRQQLAEGKMREVHNGASWLPGFLVPMPSQGTGYLSGTGMVVRTE